MAEPRTVADVAKRSGSPGKPTIRGEQAQHIKDAVREAVDRAGNGSSLAEALGVSQPTVSAWQSGASVPELPNREKLARFLGWREFQIREGVDAASHGGIRALETALDYHGHSTWPAHVVAKARREAEAGATRSAKEWASRLDQLKATEPRR